MTENVHFSRWHSPIGELTLYANTDGILAITFAENNAAVLKQFCTANLLEHPNEFIHQAVVQLNEYFAGTRKSFDLPLAPRGTEFQRQVWSALSGIPFGVTVSYKSLAAMVISDNACRAVGSANSKNPIAIMIPCHRVIGSDGRLAGFSGGVIIKAKLIAQERLINAAI
jgi:methylated-DNA-[protein]-cysteine S-methyltransferase